MSEEARIFGAIALALVAVIMAALVFAFAIDGPPCDPSGAAGARVPVSTELRP